MLRLFGWSAAAVVLGFLLWQTTVSDPIWPHWVSGMFLAVAGCLAGLRIATDSATKYICDVQRLNRFLACQNKELEDANALLLSQISDEAEVASETA
jgi:hypothetical protein